MKKDSAVSEVVGVLLMITVTLILVSIVAISMNNAVGETEKPISSRIVASGVYGKNVTFENIGGDAFSLDQIELRLSVRENPSLFTTLHGFESLFSYSGNSIISLGDRFRVESDEYATGLKFGSFSIEKGQHLTYRFYDRKTGSPVSSGEITV